jgi:hypothetical protein
LFCLQINVAADSPVRAYSLGFPDTDYNDNSFYLIATSGIYSGEFAGAVEDDLSTNWIGYVALGPKQGPDNKRDIVIAFRGTQARFRHMIMSFS